MNRPPGCGCNETNTPICAVCRKGLFTTPPATVAPCVHYGDPVRVHGSARDWRQCNHPAQPLGPTVCRCKGCGPKCAGYTQEIQ